MKKKMDFIDMAFIVTVTLVIILILCMLWIVIFETDDGTRTQEAVATAKMYYEDGDYTSMEFTTKDGNVWVVDDTICPIGAKCRITFDTKRTNTIEDDEIISIQTMIYENGN